MKDRIKSLRRVAAEEIEGAPWNWRTHPDRQRKAVAASIEELGFYDPLLVYQTADGRLRLIDGHLRRELIEAVGPQTKIPVIVTTLSEAEAKQATLTHDPLAGMAEADESILAELAGQVDAESDALRQLIAEVAGQSPAADEADAPEEKDVKIEDQYKVVVSCAGEEEQRTLYEKLTLEGWKCRLITV